MLNRENHRLGTFDSQEEAHAAYMQRPSVFTSNLHGSIDVTLTPGKARRRLNAR